MTSMLKTPRLTGLIAAAYTPLNDDGSLRLTEIPRFVDELERAGIAGIYIGGSTGEGMSLTSGERREIAEAYVAVAKGRLSTVVQVGHNSLAEARGLALHAAQTGADAISATAPSYFKIQDVAGLVAAMSDVAGGAPNLPFYYYHIPVLTGVAIDMVDFLDQASEVIPNLRGIKYTAPLVHEFQACQAHRHEAFDVVWGTDEMLLSALVVGARCGIGSTYNYAAPLYRGITDAYQRGDLVKAARLQLLSVEMVRMFNRFPFHAAAKQLLTMRGFVFGPCRRPQASLTAQQQTSLRRTLEGCALGRWLLAPHDAPVETLLDGTAAANGATSPYDGLIVHAR